MSPLLIRYFAKVVVFFLVLFLTTFFFGALFLAIALAVVTAALAGFLISSDAFSMLSKIAFASLSACCALSIAFEVVTQNLKCEYHPLIGRDHPKSARAISEERKGAKRGKV